MLCGENGAGKSTLMKIINGIYQPDSGETFIRGEKVEIESPIKAGELGISMIFQELNYMPEMSIEESLFVGRWPKKPSGRIDWKTIRERTLQLLKQENLHFDPETKLKDLSISNLQMLEILKAISRDADIIIMDEPTSSITNKEIETLFEKIADLRARGKAIVYISHKMDEIFSIADEISVLRDGKVVETRPRDAVRHRLRSSRSWSGAPSAKAIPRKTFLMGMLSLKSSTSAGRADFATFPST